MKEVLFGFDYAGVQSVKITKDGIAAALEPDSNVGSFRYNSKWAADYKIAGIDLMPQVGSPTFWPAGSGLSNYTKYTEPVGSFTINQQASYFRKEHFPNLSYDLPLCEVKAKRISNGRFIGSMLTEVLTGYDNRAGNWRTGGREWFGWGAGMSVYYNSTTGSISYGSQVTNDFVWPSGVLNELFYNNLVVWNLPGDETAITDGTPQTPVAGAHVIEIDSAGVRVAKPGFDLRSITRPTQVAFDTSRHPTKIIGAADIYCPPGSSSYDIGVTIPVNAVADVHFYQGGTIYFPAEPAGFTVQYGAEYWFSGSTIQFNNPYGGCRARFIIYAVSTEAVTSGDNDVIKQFVSGGQDVVQILRPGAGASPSFADIIVDSRWPCIQILAEGTIPVLNGTLSHIINFNGTGCFPMVKYMTVHGGGSNSNFVASWSKRVRAPFLNLCGNYKVGWSGGQGGDSTYCSLTSNQAVFHTFRGAPIRRFYKNFGDFNDNVVSYDYDPSPLYAIRYFILGIPA